MVLNTRESDDLAELMREAVGWAEAEGGKQLTMTKSRRLPFHMVSFTYR